MKYANVWCWFIWVTLFLNLLSNQLEVALLFVFRIWFVWIFVFWILSLPIILFLCYHVWCSICSLIIDHIWCSTFALLLVCPREKLFTWHKFTSANIAFECFRGATNCPDNNIRFYWFYKWRFQIFQESLTLINVSKWSYQAQFAANVEHIERPCPLGDGNIENGYTEKL